MHPGQITKEILDAALAPHRHNKFGKRYRVVYLPKWMIENTLLWCGDGIEQKTINKDILSKLSRWMSERQYQILNMRYFEGMKFKQIGKKLGITESGAWQSHARALDKARRKANLAWKSFST